MAQLLDAAMSLPVAIFSFLLIIVVVYWLLVVISGAVFDGGDDSRVGGVPLNIFLSLLVVQAWLVSMASAMLLDDIGTAGDLVVTSITPVVAVLAAWAGTALLARPIRRRIPARPPRSGSDFVGTMCIVRSGAVRPDFGEAEVSAVIGTPRLVQVRQKGADDLHAGSTALIVDYDAGHDLYWVKAFEPDLGTH